MPKKAIPAYKILAVLVFFIVLPLWLSACNDKLSLKNMDIVIGNFWGDWDAETRKAANDTEKKLIDYRIKIQKENQFKIREKQVGSWEEMAKIAASSILDGKPAAQVMYLQPNWVMMLIKQNLLYPVNASKTVDFSSSKPVDWNKEVIDSMTFDGKAYGFAIGHGTSRHGTGLFFNKRLFREAGIDPMLPYDMQKDGRWTWDAFMELCKRLTGTAKDGKTKTYAMTADLSTDVLDAVIASNGAHYVGRDSSGKFVNATNSPEFLEALQFAMNMYKEGILMPRPENANWDWYKPMFTGGKAALMISPEWAAHDLQNMADDWGYVIFPRGPSVNDYHYTTDENVMVIPSTYSAEEVDKILYAVQLWYTPVDDNPDSWKRELYKQYRDPRAVDETLAIFHNPKYGSIGNYVYVPGLERGDIAWSMWYSGGTAAQLVASVAGKWDKIIGEANIINTK